MMMVMKSSEKMKNKPPKDSLTLLPCFYFVELPIVASSMVSLYFLELTDVLQPPLVGFRCYDRHLSKPYVDGGDELIPLLMLLSLAFAGPAASIMLLEALLYCLQSRLKLRTPEGSITAGGCSFNSFLRRTVRFVGVHVFGLCATALVTDVIQLSTGRHAPFFLTVCKPNYTLAPGSCDSNAFITRDICSGYDQHAILAARKSFPSQHATLSAFAAVYVSMYFNSTISDSTKLLKPLLVFGFVIAAALTGLTQITQHRSHPVDVYVGFLIGAFIAAYLALHAVANFKSPDDVTVASPPAPPKEDPLRALTERGHHSVYNKGPASASESHDEITAATGSSRGPVAPPLLDQLEAMGPLGPLGPLQREQDSMGSLKRASVDVELLAPRSTMGKETMLTFSHTLPRASINIAPPGPDGVLQAPVQPVQPVQRRLKAVQVPVDPIRSQQLVTEWKQCSLEMRGLGGQDQVLGDQGLGMRNYGGREHILGGQNQELGVQDQDLTGRSQVLGGQDQGDTSEDGSDEGSVGKGGAQTSGGRGGRLTSRNATPPPEGAKAIATPRPHHTPEAGPPPVSPKSAVTRAKWLAIREKAGCAVGGAGRSSSQPPRLMQVVALSKQQGLLPSHSPSPSSSSSGTASSSSDSASSAESPRYQGENGSIITVDAHAPHHPVVQAPPPPQAQSLTGKDGPWEWAGPSDPYNLSSNSFRPQRRPTSPRAAAIPLPPDMALPSQAPPTQVTMRRKTALVLLEREGSGPGQQDHYYLQGPQGPQGPQGRRYKD